ncbi:hypothetical protein LU276_04500 [Moraxella haemolytica]|uniref:hypothetical protein n=1 Tax=Moraxella TaxID=475 RepID=UPI0025429759|nr:hypothetical protein [Moraxella sp. ZY171148]WII96076.1 hypothetical protein LU276_04500 [Moraxella sp. ZY171148]
MSDKADDELIKRLIKEAEALIEEELQKKLATQQPRISQEELLAPDLHESIHKELTQDVDTNKPKRRGRPKKAKPADEVVDLGENKKPKVKRKKPIAKSLVKERQNGEMMVKEAVLEFVEREDGVLTLQEVGREHEPMVTIAFSEQAKAIIGDDVQMVGQSMIHAAIATVMQRQMSSWHAHVYDEMPKHYS